MCTVRLVGQRMEKEPKRNRGKTKQRKRGINLFSKGRNTNRRRPVDDPIHIFDITTNVTSPRVTTSVQLMPNVSGSDPRIYWQVEGISSHLLGDNITLSWNSSGTYQINVTATNPISTEFASTNVTVRNASKSNSQPVMIATPICVTIFSILFVVLGVTYHRWYFRRRGVETANFVFVPTPTKKKRSAWNILSAPFSPRRPTNTSYGALELGEDSL
eukprot:m.84741 g.84741  ORF g.84741 m.84741 type:complete len:216 (+) comp21212_c0_seq2:15-662(+)